MESDESEEEEEESEGDSEVDVFSMCYSDCDRVYGHVWINQDDMDEDWYENKKYRLTGDDPSSPLDHLSCLRPVQDYDLKAIASFTFMIKIRHSERYSLYENTVTAVMISKKPCYYDNNSTRYVNIFDACNL